MFICNWLIKCVEKTIIIMLLDDVKLFNIPLNINEVMQLVSSPSSGAINLFVGKSLSVVMYNYLWK